MSLSEHQNDDIPYLGIWECYYLKRGQKSKNTSPTLIWTSFLLSFYTKLKQNFQYTMHFESALDCWKTGCPASFEKKTGCNSKGSQSFFLATI
jgi:hypothetical protein